MKRLNTVSEVVDHLGGHHAVAELTGRSPSHVRNWETLNRFSAQTFVTVNVALHVADATAPAKLWGQDGRGRRVRVRGFELTAA